MPWLTRLATVARRTGMPVVEVPGWKTRGHGPQPSVEGVVCHHTAGPAAGGNYPSLNVVRDGRPGLDGPLSHFGLGRDGTIYVIAAGRCWHNAPSTSKKHANSTSIGIEAENNGRQSWPAVQLLAYQRLCAELCREFGLAAHRVMGHKEVNTGKPDPHSIDMDGFRVQVARLLAGRAPALPETTEEDVVAKLPTLKQGADGFDVKTVRGCLFARGGVPDTSYSGPEGLKGWLESTRFDAALTKDVKAFQADHKLDADGVVGPLTWAKLLRAI